MAASVFNDHPPERDSLHDNTTPISVEDGVGKAVASVWRALNADSLFHLVMLTIELSGMR